MKKCFIGTMTLEAIEKEISYWEEMKELWNRCDLLPDDDVVTATYKLYFRLQNGTEVWKELKRLGIADFSVPKEVTTLIEKGGISDKLLEQRTKAIQKANHGYAMRRS